MTVALYARVSTSDQRCEVQINEIRQYATARGWEIKPEHEYVDQGWSGTKASRPAMDRLMRDAIQRKVDVIMVFKLDRFGRSVQNLCNSLAELESAGVRFIATSQGIDTDANNPLTRLMMVILSGIAAFERELIKERVAAGMRKAQQSGTRSGRPIGRPVRILDRQAVWDRRDQGATFTQLEVEFQIGRGHVQRILAARPKSRLKAG